MIERTESLDLTEFPGAFQRALETWLLHLEQQRAGRGVLRVQLAELTARFSVNYEDDVPAGLPELGRPLRTHEDFGPRLPRSHDPLRTRPGWASEGQWNEDPGPAVVVAEDEPRQPREQLPMDWDPQF